MSETPATYTPGPPGVPVGWLGPGPEPPFPGLTPAPARCYDTPR